MTKQSTFLRGLGVAIGVFVLLVLLSGAFANADTLPALIGAKSVDKISLGGGQAAYVTVLHDRETGCEYIAYDGRDHGAAITPRLTGHSAGNGGFEEQICHK